MTFTLKITCDNAAFDDDRPADEIARILRAAADKVAAGHDCGPCVDLNGNKVGEFKIDS